MAEPHKRRASSDDLAERIAAAQAARRKPARNRTGAVRGWEIAFRMVIELIVGIAIGGGFGYGIDWLFGSLPVFTLIFGLLGFAAGVRVMLRSAEEVSRHNRAAEAREADNEASEGADRPRDMRQDERGERGIRR
ncbi:MAG: AtpZ/AtpI family protein [Pseudomonadota bacterium]